MSFTFEDAAPVKREVVGRTAEPNPFADVVQSIALKKDNEGLPVAKSFIIPTGDKNDKDKYPAIEKVKRQLGDAGTLATPQCSVMKDVSISGKQAKVTFWTVPLITRERKPKTDAAE